MLDTLRVDRAIYLGADGALDRVVEAWATELVHGEPSDEAVWERASRGCARSEAAAIDEFLRRERKRGQLKVFECLPHATARTIEIFEGLVAVILHDKALLDEEDILPASILVFGKSREPIVHKVGPRTFVSPGPLGHPRGGLVLLADEAEAVVARFYARDGSCVGEHAVASLSRAVHVTVN